MFKTFDEYLTKYLKYLVLGICLVAFVAHTFVDFSFLGMITSAIAAVFLHANWDSL